jgi:hypothetical protein
VKSTPFQFSNRVGLTFSHSLIFTHALGVASITFYPAVAMGGQRRKNKAKKEDSARCSMGE